MVSPEAVETLFSAASAHSMCQVRQRMPQTAGRPEEAECDFAAQANAMVIKNAERYYRNMFFQGYTSVCLEPATHRGESLVWHAGAHNSHLGDARATDMGIRRGEVNVGQLVREHVGDRHTDLIASLGFTTHTGTVAAADDWNEPVKNMRVNPSLPDINDLRKLCLRHTHTRVLRLGHYENIMHAMARPAFGLQLTAAHGGARDISDVEALRAVRACLEGPRLERAIGVIYRPNTERFSHYFQTWASSWDLILCQNLDRRQRRGLGMQSEEAEGFESPETLISDTWAALCRYLPEQFDIVMHIDKTSAVEPLDPGAHFEKAKQHPDLPETYPFAV
ncbi:MAG: hypothetical protein MMC33_010740 [Icmadophila ericetorum]|nr:hypothetical protein [Icmadophila ericetorum]